MSKIIQAVNAMVSNPEYITDVIAGEVGNELFFCYDTKHKWSIINDNNTFSLHYYPLAHSINELAKMPPENWEDFKNMITYYNSEFVSKEAKDSIQELWMIVQEKRFGMDVVLNDIIRTGFV